MMYYLKLIESRIQILRKETDWFESTSKENCTTKY